MIRYDDIAQGIMPYDKIADTRYSIDSWGQKDLPVHLNYGISYRSVTPVNTERLLSAERSWQNPYRCQFVPNIASLCSHRAGSRDSGIHGRFT